ncbi:MAG TPA: serpin family protein [Acidimicrobiales bacterium]|nr:serpin family protein [Acidimicrobiales bacterium]
MGESSNDWLEDRLQPLRSTPGGGAGRWPSAEELRARSDRWRRRRVALVSGGACSALAIVLVVALLLVPGSAGHQPAAEHPRPGGISKLAGPDGSIHLVAALTGSARPHSPADAAAVAVAEQAFALDLTRLEASESGNANVLLSPLSADVDLAMLELGSAGATAHEIAAALQTAGLTTAAQAIGWGDLVQGLVGGQPAGELQLANSVWIAQHVSVEAAFLQAAAQSFGDDSYQADFRTSEATQAINAWVDKATAGRITELFAANELPPSTELVLANALHFHAAWTRNLFASAVQKNELFHPASGPSVSIPMIVDSQDTFDAGVTSEYSAVQLPYTNGRYAALLVEPTSTMAGFLRSLTPTRLAAIAAGLKPQFVALSMPDLTLSSRPLLNRPLSALGMGAVFVNADFSPMLGQAGATNQALALVQQASALKVNQWGTDAAAATGSVVIPTAAHQVSTTISFDHPYLFLIRDRHTGTILFSSVVNNPAAG